MMRIVVVEIAIETVIGAALTVGIVETVEIVLWIVVIETVAVATTIVITVIVVIDVEADPEGDEVAAVAADTVVAGDSVEDHTRVHAQGRDPTAAPVQADV
uniref:Uncharacterized protein n=1 Tax=Anopheles darlingi TaxID=43151 RepID=A0A2M4D1K6_ANODA